MKKLFLIIFLFFLSAYTSKSEGCLEEGIEFTNQTQINNFPDEYPNCTFIKGDVIITGAQIINLNGLHSITRIEGSLIIHHNDQLTDISGLANLQTVGGDLNINNNNSLTALIGFSSLSNIGGDMKIERNLNMEDLSGAVSLINIGQRLDIIENPNLENLNGLDVLTWINGILLIEQNDNLSTLAGIDNVNYFGGIEIRNNPLLSECNVASICNYLSGDNPLTAELNAQGCSSKAQILQKCGISSTNNSHSGNFISNAVIFPNPAESKAEIHLEHQVNGIARIYDNLGKLIKNRKFSGHVLELNVQDLSSGSYFVIINTDENFFIKKLNIAE